MPNDGPRISGGPNRPRSPGREKKYHIGIMETTVIPGLGGGEGRGGGRAESRAINRVIFCRRVAQMQKSRNAQERILPRSPVPPVL